MENTKKAPLIHRPSAFKVGDAVSVTGTDGAINVAGWSGKWAASHQLRVGSKLVIVETHPQRGFADNRGLWFPSAALAKYDGDANYSDAFKVGDKVRVVRIVKRAVGWETSWDSEMDKVIGMVGTVVQVEPRYGPQLEFGSGYGRWYFPSCALEPANKPKVRRVRVGPGPWDAAPCPHLRWNLMAFYREKLLITGFFPPTTDMEGKPVDRMAFANGEIQIGCTKCNVSTRFKF